jgi:spore coat protein A
VQIAPGECNLVVDFTPHRGAQLLHMSDAITLMQFRIAAALVSDPRKLPATLRAAPRIAESAASRIGRMTLDKQQNMVAESMGMLLSKTAWRMPSTAKPVLDSTEIWELVNLTDDVHPVHLHIVRLQILDRRRFAAFQFMTFGTLRFTNPATGPEANELGWKDMARVNAKTLTRSIVPSAGYPGRYVWHYHILEHEDDEMMRPYEILPASS